MHLTQCVWDINDAFFHCAFSTLFDSIFKSSQDMIIGKSWRISSFVKENPKKHPSPWEKMPVIAQRNTSILLLLIIFPRIPRRHFDVFGLLLWNSALQFKIKSGMKHPQFPEGKFDHPSYHTRPPEPVKIPREYCSSSKSRWSSLRLKLG